MRYNPPLVGILAAATHGSHLYGTNRPTSDHDFKAITLPPYRSLILNKPLHVERYRFDAHGNPVGQGDTMPDNGYEAEHVPVQKFVHDYLGGQTYAIEVVYAVRHGYHKQHVNGVLTPHFEELCDTLAKSFLHKNVAGMTGFAVKQTFDYVRRGERLNATRAVLREVDDVLSKTEAAFSSLRLDTVCGIEMTILDVLAARTRLEIGTSVNQGKTLRTLKLNGREYLETTALLHFRHAVSQLVDQYGERSTKAAETDVDWKSLSHAVRVYQQVLELLDFGVISFPRPNVSSLLKIRNGELPLENVKDLLRNLDDLVVEAIASSKLPVVDEAMRARAETMLYDWLIKAY